jgi:hypothetical protein
MKKAVLPKFEFCAVRNLDDVIKFA